MGNLRVEKYSKALLDAADALEEVGIAADVITTVLTDTSEEVGIAADVITTVLIDSGSTAVVMDTIALLDTDPLESSPDDPESDMQLPSQ